MPEFFFGLNQLSLFAPVLLSESCRLGIDILDIDRFIDARRRRSSSSITARLTSPSICIGGIF